MKKQIKADVVVKPAEDVRVVECAIEYKKVAEIIGNIKRDLIAFESPEFWNIHTNIDILQDMLHIEDYENMPDWVKKGAKCRLRPQFDGHKPKRVAKIKEIKNGVVVLESGEYVTLARVDAFIDKYEVL